MEDERVPIGETRQQYAKNAADGRWVNALTEVRRDGVNYVCGCTEKHPMMLRRPSGRNGIRVIRKHFSHYPGSGTVCSAGGESAKHLMAKHRVREFFMERGHTLTIEESKCYKCSATVTATFESEHYEVALEQRIENKKWRYDCLVVTRGDSVPVYAVEVVVTHWSTAEKMRGTRLMGVGISEVAADHIIRHDPINSTMVLENQGRHKICHQCIAAADAPAFLAAFEDEQRQWHALENTQWSEYMRLFLTGYGGLISIKGYFIRKKIREEESKKRKYSTNYYTVSLNGNISYLECAHVPPSNLPHAVEPKEMVLSYTPDIRGFFTKPPKRADASRAATRGILSPPM